MSAEEGLNDKIEGEEEFDKDKEFEKYRAELKRRQSRHRYVPNDSYCKLEKELKSRNIFNVHGVSALLHLSYEKLGCFLRSRLGLKAYVSLLESCDQDMLDYCSGTLLMSLSISTDAIPDDILLLIEEFFENLPIEKTLKYINKAKLGWGGRSITYVCNNMKLMNIIMKYVNIVTDHDQSNYNVLMYACRNEQKSLEKINLLLDCGININAQTSENWTALMFCCASLNVQNATNDTYKNMEDVIELLIFRGADVLIKSNIGKTAFDYLKDKQNFSPQLLSMLEGTTRINRTKKAMST